MNLENIFKFPPDKLFSHLVDGKKVCQNIQVNDIAFLRIFLLTTQLRLFFVFDFFIQDFLQFSIHEQIFKVFLFIMYNNDR